MNYGSIAIRRDKLLHLTNKDNSTKFISIIVYKCQIIRGVREMSEFTKEELEEIKRCLKYMINGGVTPYSLLTMDIKKKIQSMIDNYCEHEHLKGVGKEYRVCRMCGSEVNSEFEVT